MPVKQQKKDISKQGFEEEKQSLSKKDTSAPGLASDSLSKLSNSTSKSKKKKRLGLRLTAIFLVLVFVFGAVIYKYNEWKTLKSLAELHSSYLVEEAQQQQKINQKIEELELEAKAETEEAEDNEEEEIDYGELDPEKVINETDEAIGEFKIVDDLYQTYLNLLLDHQTGYQDFQKKQTKFLLGKKKEFVNSLVNVQDQYYQTEINDLKRNMAVLRYFQDLTVTNQDSIMLNIFASRTDNFQDDEAVMDEFNLLANLDIYTAAEYEFPYQEEIEHYVPYGLEILQKHQAFLGGTYEAINELVAENYQSAAYKFSRLGDEIAGMSSVNFDRAEDEVKDDSEADKKVLAESLLKKLNLIEEFAQDKSNQYPGLGNIDQWERPLLACHVYIYKADLFAAKKDEYPEADDLSSLDQVLDEISPSTAWILETDYVSQIKFSTENERSIYECQDLDGNTYRYTYSLDDDEAEEDETEDGQEAEEDN